MFISRRGAVRVVGVLGRVVAPVLMGGHRLGSIRRVMSRVGVSVRVRWDRVRMLVMLLLLLLWPLHPFR